MNTQTQRRHTEESHVKTETRGWGDAATSQGTPRMTRSPQKLGRSKEGFLPKNLRAGVPNLQDLMSELELM